MFSPCFVCTFGLSNSKYESRITPKPLFFLGEQILVDMV